MPVSVLETLIETAREGVEPFQRYHRLEQSVLDLEDEYDLYDSSIPLVEATEEYPYDEVTDSIIESVAPLGEDYQSRVEEALNNRWIDVYETKGKRSGAYSAGVYGVHPYMLLNYNGTLNVFTLAHELGHTIHTLLAERGAALRDLELHDLCRRGRLHTQRSTAPGPYAGATDDPTSAPSYYSIRSTRSPAPSTRKPCSPTSSFRPTGWWRTDNRSRPIRSPGLYREIIETYYGDTAELDDLYDVTWARIPHFFNSPYYVYQYATCYASSAKLVDEILGAAGQAQEDSVQRYLDLLRAGGSDHPMNLLRDAGVDLRDEHRARCGRPTRRDGRYARGRIEAL